jgi:hypothetical protein
MASTGADGGADRGDSFGGGGDGSDGSASLGKTAGQIAGDRAASLGIGNVGAIAAAADAAAEASSESGTTVDPNDYIGQIGVDYLEKDRAAQSLELAQDMLGDVPLGIKAFAGMIPGGSIAMNAGALLSGFVKSSPDGYTFGGGSQLSDEGGGSTGDRSLRSPSSAGDLDSTDFLNDLIGGGNVADNDGDLLSQLYASQGINRTPISFKVGGQTVSFTPKAQRDELSMLLNYLLEKESGGRAQQQIQQNEPSFVDKTSQLLGLGSDILGLWNAF